MTLVQTRTDAGQPYRPPEHRPRLRLKPKVSTTGHVDGAWWPHSDDLPMELPDLLAELSVRLGRIRRVMYNLDEWANAPAKLTAGGHAVRLDGYRRQPANTIEVLGLDRGRIALLVVPPHTDPERAHTTMMAAAGPHNDATVDGLLATNTRAPEIRGQAAVAQQRWESEGGAT